MSKDQATRCPSAQRLSRAFPDQADPELLAHLESCATCQSDWNALARLRRLGQSIAVPPLQPAARDAIFAALLYHAERKKHVTIDKAPRWRWLAAAAALVVLVGSLAVLRPRLGRGASESSVRASVLAIGPSRFERTALPSEQLVRLYEGELQLEVEKLHSGERFRVRVGEAEVEVRGTVFTVAAHADRLLRVAVKSGRVEVRPHRGVAVLLDPGQQWLAPLQELTKEGAASLPAPAVPALVSTSAPETRTSSVPESPLKDLNRTPAKRPGRSVPRTGSDSVPAASTGPAEQAFARGFQSLKQGRFADAAPELERAASLSPAGPLAEDAQFWSGVAWARAGRSKEAIQQFRSLLAAHPKTPRAGETAAALGWLLLRVQKVDEAERAFQRAMTERAVEVRESAQSGLDAVRAARIKSKSLP